MYSFYQLMEKGLHDKFHKQLLLVCPQRDPDDVFVIFVIFWSIVVVVLLVAPSDSLRGSVRPSVGWSVGWSV